MIRLTATTGLVISAALALVACTPVPRNSSPESELLQSQIVSAIIEWSKTNSPVMELSKMPAVRSFDYICAVPEYESHSLIENELPSVAEYRGSTGIHVPEMKIAFMGVKNDTAHVSYISLYDLSLRNTQQRCRESEAALLIRQRRVSASTVPVASLGE